MDVPNPQRWLLTQVLLWAALLVYVPLSVGAVGRTATQAAVWLGAMAASFAALFLAIGAGRRVADYVTTARFVGLLAVCWIAWTGDGLGWWLFAAAVGVVSADLLDGLCARRFGGSPAGALLDMETDQFTTLALALLIHGTVGVGPWVLVLPGFRYAYVAYMQLSGGPAHDPKPCDGDNSRARLICAAVMVLMLVALLPAASFLVSSLACGVAIVLLAYSYGSDLVFLSRQSAS